MYQINPTTNELIELRAKRFGDLGFREKEHLQEWLANCPTALGEDLLIIQKEFDGFDETRERLDLLALDKSGNLVLIENKLDDSGRDVVWQSLKYAKEYDGYNRKNWPDMIDWLVEHVALMEKVFRPQLGAVKRGLKG